MPNWSYNHYAVKSSTKNVLNFVNEGLKNLGLEPMNNIKEAIESLWEHKNVSMATFRPIPETFLKYDTTNKKRGRYDKDWDTKEPLFNSDEEYESYSKGYDEAVKYQKETYGVVGWYDYNCKIHFGCKWNAEVELESFSVDEEKDITTIFLKGETPWRFPYLWLEYVKNTFGLNVFLCSHEEGDLYHLAKEIGGEIIGGYRDINDFENAPKESEFNNEEEYYDSLNTFENCVNEVLDNMYYDYVNSYVVKNEEKLSDDKVA